MVVGQVLKTGSPNPFLARFTRLPAHEGDHVGSPAHVDLADGLVNTASYYTYPGWLAIPPCAETVTRVVPRAIARISSDQFQRFRTILGNNVRPIRARPESFLVRSR